MADLDMSRKDAGMGHLCVKQAGRISSGRVKQAFPVGWQVPLYLGAVRWLWLTGRWTPVQADVAKARQVASAF